MFWVKGVKIHPLSAEFFACVLVAVRVRFSVVCHVANLTYLRLLISRHSCQILVVMGKKFGFLAESPTTADLYKRYARLFDRAALMYCASLKNSLRYQVIS